MCLAQFQLFQIARSIFLISSGTVTFIKWKLIEIIDRFGISGLSYLGDISAYLYRRVEKQYAVAAVYVTN